jgi:hypothetical protein
MSMIIAVQNLSTLVTDEQAYDMAMIADYQLRHHMAAAWGIQPPLLAYRQEGAPQKFGALIGILDDADQAGILGWHTEGPDASVYGRVFARPVLDNGGTVMSGRLSVCSVLSHEVLETAGDAACNGWSQRGDGLLVARELCDPVEGDTYPVTITSRGGTGLTGTVSNFVFPAWFDPDAKGAPYDWMNTLSAPFQVRPDGYVIVMSAGTVTEQWGESYPGWKIATKEHPTARTARRDSSVVPESQPEGPVPTSLA